MVRDEKGHRKGLNEMQEFGPGLFVPASAATLLPEEES